MGLNSQGLNVNDRRETWLFSEVEKKLDGTQVLRRSGWTVVQYGDDPEQFLEPTPNEALYDTINSLSTSSPQVNALNPSGNGRFVGFKVIKGRLCECHSFDDVDVSTLNFDFGGRTPTGF